MKFNRDIITRGFSSFYKNILKTSGFNTTQGANLHKFLDFVETDDTWAVLPQIAYLLATVGHETAWSFAPIKEFRAKDGRIKEVQDRYWNTGFYGRGFIQLTWKRNYEAFSKILGVNLVSNPDLLLRPEISYRITAYGMQKGVFTGVKLGDHVNEFKKDYVNARRVVNGTDRAQLIATYASNIEKILISAYIPDVEEPLTFVEDTPYVEPVEQNSVEQPKVQVIDKTEPKITSGIGKWKAAISGILGSLSISLASVWAWVENKLQSDLVIWVVIATVLIGAIILVAYMVIRSKEKMKREQMAHEIMMKELEIRANPNYSNVEVRKW